MLIKVSKTILNFRFCEVQPQPVEEPNICVTHPVTALKTLRNFGHLITNLHLEYMLFFLPKKMPYNHTKFCKFIEHYLSEYCSKSLQQISLQGNLCTSIHTILEDIHKPFYGVKAVHIEKCAFGEVLPFNTVFPNLQSLKLGFNAWNCPSAIRNKFNSLENLWFEDRIFLVGQAKFEEKDIEDFFRLNPQLQNAVLNLWINTNSNFTARLQKYCSNLQIRHCSQYQRSYFSFDAFFNKEGYGNRKTFTEIPESSPIKISLKYKNSLEKLGKFHTELRHAFTRYFGK